MTAFDNTYLGQMRRNRDVLFFALNAFGWCAWGLGQYLAFAFYADQSSAGSPFHLVIFVGVGSGILLTTLLRYLCRWLWRQRPLTLIVGALVAAYLSALPMRVVINLAQQRFVESDWKIEHWYEYFMNVIPTSYLLVCWMGIYFSIHYYEANQKERETALRATALAQSAQLKMLRYQLNPHFLFNTLNAISTLVLDQRNAVANTVVTRLAEFLRYTLDQDPMKTVTLTQEAAALNLYLDIEKMRFGSRLAVTIDIDPAAGSAPVPSLLLQPLIENAIKYAISPSEQGGSIAIRGHVEGNEIVLSVEDNGPGLIDTSRIDSGRGVGLRNTRERLLAMYGNRARVEILNTDPGLRIALRFPARLHEVARA
jgi:two-component system, LytTR family, sensor kinase